MPFLGAAIASQKLTSAGELGLALVRRDEQLGRRCESIQAQEIPPRHTDISGTGSGLGRTRIANVVPVPADYATIRDENIARYGWDTAVLDLLGQLYSERTHFIFELIQNAEDAGATELAFELFGDRLEAAQCDPDGRAAPPLRNALPGRAVQPGTVRAARPGARPRRAQLAVAGRPGLTAGRPLTLRSGGLLPGTSNRSRVPCREFILVP